MIKKLVLKKNPEYTPTPARSVLVKIEAVFDIKDIREMEDVLENLQQYGAAEVVEKTFIEEGFDAAARILARRTVP